MAASIQVSNLPDQIRAQYDSYETGLGPMSRSSQKQQASNSDDIQLLKFPSTKNILWDHVKVGEPITLNVSYYRKPRLCIAEKVLRFAQRHAESTDQAVCSSMLVGSLDIEEDGEGVVLNVERLDTTGNANSSSSHAAGDILIPFTVQRTSSDRGSTMNDYAGALNLLKERCCSKDSIDVGNFLLTKGWCSFYNTGEKCVHHVEFDMVTMGTEITAVPINPVPIVPTALSKNLSGPMSISHMQGTAKTGYLTMDHTRKILLVLESDPKVSNLPVVGIWVSGVCYAYSAYVWACCLRYIHNASLQDRVCSAPEPFLLVLYNPSHSKPEFYECCPSTGTSKMTFDIFTGYEAVNMSKTSGSFNDLVEVELSVVDSGPKKDFFDAALGEFSPNLKLTDSARSKSPELSSQDDITPRCQPAPHKARMLMAQSMVPEVSLFFGDGDSTAYVPQVQNPSVPGKGLRLQMPSHNASNGQSKPTPQSQFSYRIPGQQAIPLSTSKPGVLPTSKSSLQQKQRVREMTGSQTVIPSLSSNDRVPPSCPVSVSQPYSHHNGAVGAAMPGRPHIDHFRTASDPVQSTQYPDNGQSYPVYSAPQPMSAPVFQNGGGYPSLPVQSHSSHGSRNGYCNCPSCPKPSQQPYSMPSSNSGLHSQYPQPTPMYSQNYRPVTPQQPMQHPQPSAQPRYPPSSHPAPVHPQSGLPMMQNRHHSVPSSAFQQYQNNNPNGHVPQKSIQQGVIPYTPPEGPEYTSRQQQGQEVLVPSNYNFQPTGTSENHGKDLSSRTSQARTDFPRTLEVGQQNGGQHSDSSGRSSDDSGLSITPEKHHSPATSSPYTNNPQTQPSSNNQNQLTKPGLFSQAGGVNWDNVPPEIYQLLLSQDKQLKELQAQIQLLTTQQALQTLNNSAGNASSGESKQTVEKCSVAVNTSLQIPDKHNQVSVCMQTSPQRLEQRVETSHPSNLHTSSRDITQSSGSGSGYDGRTPADIRHRGRLPMNSTQKEDLELDMSQGELVALINNMHDKTIDSVQSDMIVDLPSFQSSPTRSPQSQVSQTTPFNLSPRSPISASMCEQDQQASDSETSDTDIEEPASTDNPEYYSKLMDNIKRLLSQNTTGDTGIDGYQGDMSSDPSTPMKLAHENIQLGEQLQSFLRFDQTTKTTDTTFIPKINYVSMFLDSDTDTDTSMEINAMAMKYLKDDQLTQLTKLQAKSKVLGGKSGAGRAAFLQKILKNEEDSTPTVTNFGISPNDMTFATKRYMEKHGLLDGPQSGSTTQSESTYNESYQLKTNYSTMSSGSDGPAEITHEVVRTPVRRKPTSDIPVTPALARNTADHFYSNSTTPTNNYQPRHLTPQAAQHVQNWVMNGNDSGNDSVPHSYNTSVLPHSTSAPKSHNCSVPQSHNSTPYSHNTAVPYNKDSVGANGRFASPYITPSPASRPKHSPPEKDVHTNGYLNDGRGDYVRNQPKPVQGQDVQRYHNNWQQFTRPTDEDDRILDITRLKQLPKLL